jgi:hypothetical protein
LYQSKPGARSKTSTASTTAAVCGPPFLILAHGGGPGVGIRVRKFALLTPVAYDILPLITLGGDNSGI